VIASAIGFMAAILALIVIRRPSALPAAAAAEATVPRRIHVATGAVEPM